MSQQEKEIQYINQQQRNTTKFVEGDNGVPYITFPILSQFSFIRHGFSTRLGGVSTGVYESMNLAFNRTDDPALVSENFERITKAIGTKPERCVFSQQTHTCNVLVVGENHRGMGVVRERDFHDIDGLITNAPQVCLVTAYADCVPLFFVDPVHRCIAASHSGWRGTIADITAQTLKVMQEQFGTAASDVFAMIGPSICAHCYEVSEDVASQFIAAYADCEETVVTPKGNGKYLLNLHKANYYNMVRSGIPANQIDLTDICTCCNPKLLYSHRASQGKRGVLCGFIEII